MKKLLLAAAALGALTVAAPAAAQNVSGGVTITLGTPGYNPYTVYNPYSQYRYNPYGYTSPYRYGYTSPYTRPVPYYGNSRGYYGPITRTISGLYLCQRNRNRTGILYNRYTGRPVRYTYELRQPSTLRCH